MVTMSRRWVRHCHRCAPSDTYEPNSRGYSRGGKFPGKLWTVIIPTLYRRYQRYHVGTADTFSSHLMYYVCVLLCTHHSRYSITVKVKVKVFFMSHMYITTQGHASDVTGDSTWEAASRVCCCEGSGSKAANLH